MKFKVGDIGIYRYKDYYLIRKVLESYAVGNKEYVFLRFINSNVKLLSSGIYLSKSVELLTNEEKLEIL